MNNKEFPFLYLFYIGSFLFKISPHLAINIKYLPSFGRLVDSYSSQENHRVILQGIYQRVNSLLN